MLGKIGKPVMPADAVDLLLECHGRIRAFLAMARRLGEAVDESAEAVSDAAFQVHRYFTLALPLHARDEEESILPLLRGRDPLVAPQLDVMVREHREHQRPLGQLIDACAEIGADPGRHPVLASSVRRFAVELDRHFFHHLAREEEVIFPAVRRLLDAATDASIVKEIRLRRSE
jgi:iron-sulfur cluster repair protein YtfE (RIC family)